MLTLAIFKMAFIDGDPQAIFVLLIALALLVMLERGWFDGFRW